MAAGAWHMLCAVGMVQIELSDLEAAALYLAAEKQGVPAPEVVRQWVRLHLGPPCPTCGCPRSVALDGAYLDETAPEGEQWRSVFQEGKRLLRCQNEACPDHGTVVVDDPAIAQVH